MTPQRPPTAGTPARRWSRLFVAGALACLLALALVAPHLTSGAELVRLRHALALGPDASPDADWQPPDWPADYLTEQVPPDPYFVAVAQRLGLAALPDDWSRGIAIARHLVGSAPQLLGGAIQHDLRHTYEAIVQRGDGYCRDFIRTYTAIAHAAGLPMRTRAFSFDGFGGHGHIWIEIWNRDRARWQLIDVFQNYYYVDGDAEPLSALGLRQALASGSPGLRLLPLHEGVPPGWAIEAKARDYLQRGLAEWYIPWGHAVFTADAAWPTRWFAGRSRIAEGLGAVFVDVQPQIRMLATAENAGQRADMRSLRWRVQAAGALALLGLVLLVAAAVVRRPRRAVSPAGASAWPVVCVVGPLPPPSGGMANQCEQLLRLLRSEGVDVSLVRTNAPYRPGWVGAVPWVRAGFRLLPYLVALWRRIGRAQVVHVFANSGWAWHLLAAPALVIARLRGVPVIVNYRGGLADEFLSKAPPFVPALLRGAALRVTPSAFLLRVFARHGLQAEVIPNIIDLSRFSPRTPVAFGTAPHLVVTRNLEPIYDIPTALKAFAQVRARFPGARMTVAGTGPDAAALQALARSLGVADVVVFAGRIANADIGRLYAQADLMLNPSTADNMPISILEALASGVPVVSTDAGGIPDLVQHERTALLVPVGGAQAMAAQAMRVLGDADLRARLCQAGAADVRRYAWAQVRDLWRDAYWRAADAQLPTPSLSPGGHHV